MLGSTGVTRIFRVVSPVDHSKFPGRLTSIPILSRVQLSLHKLVLSTESVNSATHDNIKSVAVCRKVRVIVYLVVSPLISHLLGKPVMAAPLVEGKTPVAVPL